MCGIGGYYQRDEYGPVWRLSGDKKHIAFYAQTDLPYEPSDNVCVGFTKWCRDHCYIRSLPLPKGFENVNAKYTLQDFRPDVIIDQPFYKDFAASELVTLFAAGSLNSLFYLNGAINSWQCLAASAIDSLPLWHPDKIFRFYIRRQVRLNSKAAPNVSLIFSVDRDTKTDDVEWALKEESVKNIAIIEHYDNRIIKAYVKNSVKETIDCEKCNKIGYLCFKNSKKSMVLMPYQGE